MADPIFFNPHNENALFTPQDGALTTAGLALNNGPLQGRAPGHLDDIGAYNVGDIWNYNSSVYTCLQNSDNKAAWKFNGNIQGLLPADAVPTPVGLWGLDVLNSAYVTNKAIDVTIAGTTTTIGFVNGKFDGTAAAKLLNGAVTAPVSKMYDQSGGTNDISQATVVNQPSLVFTQSMGWAVVFNNKNTTASGGDSPKYFSATLSAGVAPNNSSIVGVIHTTSSITPNGLISLGSAATHGIYTSIFNNIGISILGATSKIVVPSVPAIVACSILSSLATANSNNYSGTFNEGATASSQTAFTLGVSTSNAPDMYLRAFALYDRHLTATELPIIKYSFAALYPFVLPQNSKNIVINLGDSITFGLGSPERQNWSNQMLPLLKVPCSIFNVGISGVTAAGYPTASLINLGTLKYNSAVLNILLGTNDIGAGDNENTLFARIKKLVAAAKVLLPGVLVNISTLTPRTTFQSTIDAFNVLIRNNWYTFADGLIDYAADPTLSVSAANTSIFGDGLHPTTLGNSYMAPIAAAATNALLAAN